MPDVRSQPAYGERFPFVQWPPVPRKCDTSLQRPDSTRCLHEDGNRSVPVAALAPDLHYRMR